jgi:pimeloyl-ACP methyl ester carboxylesterase
MTITAPGKRRTAARRLQHGDDGAGAVQALQAAGISRFALVGHALGALIGLQLALDFPDAVSGLVLVNGWLTLSPHPPLFSGARASAARRRRTGVG